MHPPVFEKTYSAVLTPDPLIAQRQRGVLRPLFRSKLSAQSRVHLIVLIAMGDKNLFQGENPYFEFQEI